MEGGVVSRLGADLEVRGAVSKYRSIGCLISSSARSCATWAVREVSLSAAFRRCGRPDLPMTEHPLIGIMPVIRWPTPLPWSVRTTPV